MIHISNKLPMKFMIQSFLKTLLLILLQMCLSPLCLGGIIVLMYPYFKIRTLKLRKIKQLIQWHWPVVGNVKICVQFCRSWKKKRNEEMLRCPISLLFGLQLFNSRSEDPEGIGFVGRAVSSMVLEDEAWGQVVGVPWVEWLLNP